MAGTLTQTHEHTCTHVSCPAYTHSFHHKTLFFSPCCTPCKLLCCVLHGFTHKICLFELFFSMSFRYTGLLYNPLSQLFIFRPMCNWIVCCIHSGIRAWGQMSQHFFQRKGTPPLPPLVACTGLMCCMYWTICSCLTVPATS